MIAKMIGSPIWVKTDLDTGLRTLSPEFLKVVLNQAGGYNHRELFRDAISQSVKCFREMKEVK